MSLLDYWPTSENVNACIKPEAEGASDAVLLAVHRPAPLAYRIVKTNTEVETSEEELFQHFITENVPSGAHVVPITGDSGVGKSHLVRLLAARLRSLPDKERYVVVLVPKSASLSKVVELILELLPESEYGSVRQAFATALAEIAPDDAAIHFQSALEICLKNMAREVRTQLAENRLSHSLRERLDHAQRLPLLLSDAVTRDHFRSGALLRIVKNAVVGRTTLEDITQQFLPKDLDLPDNTDLDKASEAVRVYYRTVLQANDGLGKKIAAEILNDVTDAAIRQAFHLSESLGGMTLQDVILEIRKLLLKAKRELVILVEDFRALTGIQETLLNVLIQESGSGGRTEEYARMRSAIAVTSGYLTGKDTIATRAMREWIVKSVLPSDDDLLRRSKELIAAYLNAARWGESHLESARTRDPWATRTGTIGTEVFSSESSDSQSVKQLDAFGRELGVPLFPLTESAITYLATTALREGDKLVFKPRAILGVLRDILLQGRQAFVDGTFPPASIGLKKIVAADIAEWLSTLNLRDAERARYERLIVTWANDPRHRSEVARIRPEVFATFGLPPPQLPENSGFIPAPAPNAPKPAQTLTADDARETEVSKFREELESWVQPEGPPLKQGIAASIRSFLSEVLNDRIDWNCERCRKSPIKSTQISVPHARGQGSETKDAILVTQDRTDPNGELRAELLALLRFYEVWKRDPSYAEVDDDIARIRNLADRLLPNALTIVREKAAKELSVVSALLATNSRLLGFTDSGRTPNAISSFLFTSPTSHPPLLEGSAEPFVNWASMQETAKAMREPLKNELFSRCGCFQGTGAQANGVDIVRIQDALAAESTPPTGADMDFLPADLRQRLPSLAEVRALARAKQVADEAVKLHSQLISSLGESIDKHETAEAMLDLANELRESGSWPEIDVGVPHSAFKITCENFRTSPLKESLGLLERANGIGGDANPSAFIAQVAKIDFSPIIAAARFVQVAEKVVKCADRYANSIEAQQGGARPEVQVEMLLSELDRVTLELDTVTNGSAHAR